MNGGRSAARKIRKNVRRTRRAGLIGAKRRNERKNVAQLFERFDTTTARLSRSSPALADAYTLHQTEDASKHNRVERVSLKGSHRVNDCYALLYVLNSLTF